MNYCDPSGADAILVTDFSFRTGLPIFGHSRLYIQDENGVWYMTEYAGKTKKNATVKIWKEEPDLEQSNWKKFLSFLHLGGQKSVTISGDYSKSVEYSQNLEDTDLGGYNLFINNCLHYVKNVLKEGISDISSINDLLYNKSFIPFVFYNKVRKIIKKIFGEI